MPVLAWKIYRGSPVDGVPGTWWPWPSASRVMMTCPDCGVIALLDHDIGDEGNVSPSVECPLKCGFHHYVVLDEWTPGIV